MIGGPGARWNGMPDTPIGPPSSSSASFTDSTRTPGAHRVVPVSSVNPRLTASTGRARSAVVPVRSSGFAALSAQLPTWLPREAPSGAPLPATRQAAGVPSARSQPSPVSLSRPRRWGDAGPPAARAAADQKAGAPGRHRSGSDQRQRAAAAAAAAISGSERRAASGQPLTTPDSESPPRSRRASPCPAPAS